MGCGGSKDSNLVNGGMLTVWGDFFSSETRTMVAILKIANIMHKMTYID